MKIRAIIVDDVDLARDRVKRLLTGSEIEVVAECANGREAIKSIINLKPDLVFLDVQMPEIGGFEVIETIGIENMPPVIFVTAHDNFVLRAFETNAVGYLLKPLDPERLEKALARAKRQLNHETPKSEIEEKLKQLLDEVKPQPKYLKRIPVKSARGTVLILTDEIDWIGAAGHYLELHVGQTTYLIRDRLSRIVQKLDSDKFARIHRSTIVNLDRIQTLTPLFHGDYLVVLRNGVELNMSRTFHENLMSRLSE